MRRGRCTPTPAERKTAVKYSDSSRHVTRTQSIDWNRMNELFVRRKRRTERRNEVEKSRGIEKIKQEKGRVGERERRSEKRKERKETSDSL